MIKLSDYVIQYLENIGVNHIFTLVGGGCIHLADSLGKSKKITPVFNLHEQCAGICAEAYGQYKNDIGVALVTTGPGGTNIVTAIAGAWLESTPMLIIAGQVQSKDRAVNYGTRQYGFQEIDLIKLISPITKYAKTVIDANDIKYHLDMAIGYAKDGRPGPCVVEIPIDIQAKMIDPENLRTERFGICCCPKEEKFIKTIEYLNCSKRPIILAGNGIRLSGGINEFNKFINKTKIPVLTTWKAADLLEESHPLFVGRPGAIGQRGANFNQQNSDLIICVGARMDQGQLAYQPQYFAREAKKIIVDRDIKEIEKHPFHVDIAIQVGIDDFFDMLNYHINEIKIDTSEWLAHCKKTYKKYPVILPKHFESGNGELINVYAFIETLSSNLDENSLVIPGSSGTCSEVTMQAIKIKKGMRLLNTQGLGSMGFGIPSAIGGCLASGKKETICIEGDGSFFMNIQELELVRRYNLPIKIFVLNNEGYNTIKTTQNTHFNGNLVGCNEKSGLTLPSIEKNSNAYNIPFERIRTTQELKSMVAQVLKMKGPVICELWVDANHETLPRAAVYKCDDGSFDTLPMENMKPFLSAEEFLSNMLVKPVTK